jgi:hypothetical protein
MKQDDKQSLPAGQIYDLDQDIQLEPDQVVARMYQKAVRVCVYFAIRPHPVYHPAGEGMMMESYILDHIPSGLKVLGGVFGATSIEECESFASMLASTPVDWSQTRPHIDSDVQRYIRHARKAAKTCSQVTWDEFRKDQ